MHLLYGWAVGSVHMHARIDKLLQTFDEFDETETETVKSICRMGWSSPIPRAYCLWLGTPWLNESNQELLEAKPTHFGPVTCRAALFFSFWHSYHHGIQPLSHQQTHCKRNEQ